ncbi:MULTISPECIES: YlbF family regulator [unclassified Polaromonas]|uniref:YlbF family regulator n=1 Tax=unclassified Polaromonas TaxID=2638319 RepID=UPI0018C960BB|nr:MULTISPECIES: YlbF family regulator [unclassified Polaromonas]MBG6070930.1 hypothetical protein [Polaromonas sp. CG_9.7]MBG6112760.1 hypothetical protein [Polaromonas sp. CG_9.2]MDH6186235.1 hypothetical protein [Polaromonas sp. CG_23.6]
MFTRAEFFARLGRIGLCLPGVGLATALLAACSLVGPPQGAQLATPAPATPASSAAANGNAAAPPPIAADTTPAPERDAVVRMLAYADRARSMTSAELNQEIARLGNPYLPPSQLQLALVLSQLRQTPELIRAQELLTRLLANPDAQAQVLHPLARLLAARYGEQRRIEDLLEKQNQQTREVQRRLDQTNERLEALKAIERSLTSRVPAPGASAPASRGRTPPPAP